jgi:transcription antitermination protein NusB
MSAPPPDDIASRRVALWMLYALDVHAREAEAMLTDSYASLLELEPNLPQCWERVEARVFGVEGAMEELNAEIRELSPRWKLERMATIDRNILRLGIWEILREFRRPLAVINACIELGKEYGESGTPAFVNGLLDQCCTNHDIAVR